MNRSTGSRLRLMLIAGALVLGACSNPNEPTPTVVGPALDARAVSDVCFPAKGCPR